MKRVLGRMTAIAAGVIVALAATHAPVAQARVIDSYCAPTGDYCLGVFKQNGHIKLKIATFSFRGHYGLCVQTPSGNRRCHRFRLNHHGDIYSDGVDFAGHFPHREDGRYAATWHKFGPLPKPLHFRFG